MEKWAQVDVAPAVGRFAEVGRAGLLLTLVMYGLQRDKEGEGQRRDVFGNKKIKSINSK